jgi:gliding motility-associated-like protein
MYIDSLEINLFNNPIADFVASTVCQDSLVEFTDLSSVVNDTIVSWNWDFGDGNDTIENPTYTFTQSDTNVVTLIVETNTGCYDTILHTIYLRLIDPLFGYNGDCVTDFITFIDSTIVSGDSIILWEWDFGDGNTGDGNNPIHSYEIEEEYTVNLTITTASGCVDSTNLIISGTCPILDGVPYMPSAFSPNGDNNNDVLFVDGGPFSYLDYRIYNEWGELIFQSNDQNVGWDGKKDDKGQPLGVYVYVIEAINLGGEEHVIKGSVTLLK